MQKHFHRELAITKESDEDFENLTKCWICDNVYVVGVVKVRDHCHITGKYRGSSHREYRIKIKLNHKNPALLHNLKMMIHNLLLKS